MIEYRSGLVNGAYSRLRFLEWTNAGGRQLEHAVARVFPKIARRQRHVSLLVVMSTLESVALIRLDVAHFLEYAVELRPISALGPLH